MWTPKATSYEHMCQKLAAMNGLLGAAGPRVDMCSLSRTWKAVEERGVHDWVYHMRACWAPERSNIFVGEASC
jgi:hypothetical protein